MDNSIISGTASLGGVHASFHRKCSENLQVVSELEINSRVGEAQGAVGFQVDVPAANYQLKGKLDSDLNVHSTFDVRLDPLPMTAPLKLTPSVGLSVGWGRATIASTGLLRRTAFLTRSSNLSIFVHHLLFKMRIKV